MIIVTYSGGIGNQMFQAAFVEELKKCNSNIRTSDYLIKRNPAHNGFELDRVFNIKLNTNPFIELLIQIVRKIMVFQIKGLIGDSIFSFMKIFGIKVIREKDITVFDANYLKKYDKGIIVLCGYWVSELFFLHSIKQVKNLYCFDESRISFKTQTVLTQINLSKSVSIHIRRGDFYSSENQENFGNICTVEYYNKAIAVINEKIKKPSFFVFSDDIEWTQANMSIPNAEFISWNKKENSWQDMFLMAKCKHNIIANSTFSWWGAWLNQNVEKIVIAPSNLRNNSKSSDYIPDGWIGIDKHGDIMNLLHQ